MPQERIFGLHTVLAALVQSAGQVETVWLDESRVDRRADEIVQAAQDARVKLERVPKARLDQLAGGGRHQGVVASVRGMPTLGERELEAWLAQPPETPFLLVLDGVQDPHNLGACLRSADAAGAHGVIIPRDQSAPLTPVVRRVACGAAESLPIYQVKNLARALKSLKEAGVWLVGAAGDADQALFDLDLRGPLALVLGGEGAGLRRLTRESCDFLAQIPMRGQVPSLNVSVAAGICLFEAVRQRRPPARPIP